MLNFIILVVCNTAHDLQNDSKNLVNLLCQKTFKGRVVMKKALISGVMILSVAAAGNAFAALTLNLYADDVLSGKPSTNDYVQLAFTTETSNQVKLVITSHISDNADIKSVYFNFDDSLGLDSLKSLTFTKVSGDTTSSVATPFITHDEINGQKADGTGGLFDILFSFNPGSNTDAFNSNDTVAYMISGNGITAESFAGNINDEGYYAAAHLQNINSSGESTWVVATPTPIPAAAWLFGSGLLGLVGIRRKKSA